MMLAAYLLGLVLGFGLGIFVGIGVFTEAVWRGYVKIVGRQ
jgi:hypothetical protein